MIMILIKARKIAVGQFDAKDSISAIFSAWSVR